MSNIYYLYWVDSISRIRKHHPNMKDWKFRVFFINTWANALNCWIILIWLKYFEIFQIELIKLDLFPGDLLDKFFSFSIVFFLPSGLLNYFFIFYKDKYKTLMNRYPSPKYPYALIYGMTMILGAFITAVIYGVIS